MYIMDYSIYPSIHPYDQILLDIIYLLIPIGLLFHFIINSLLISYLVTGLHTLRPY